MKRHLVTSLTFMIAALAASGLVSSDVRESTSRKFIPAAFLPMSDQAVSEFSDFDPAEGITRADVHFVACGPEAAPTTAVVLGTNRSMRADLQPLSSAVVPPSTLAARDLPGIVKLEPETDVWGSETVIAHCSATRIAENWFITAAHCVDDDFDRLVIKAGSEQLSSTSIQRVEADYAVCHGSYAGNRNNYVYDLALVHVSDTKLPQLRNVPRIAWGETNHPFDRQVYASARVGGWGLIEYGGDLADFLQKEELPVSNIRPEMIELNSRYGRGPCVGDSGGPLVIEDDGKPVLMGVLSLLGANREGRICQGDYTASYINLSSHREWVRRTIAVCELNDSVCRQG